MALSPSATIDLLRQLDHLPNKKLGQNFLIDGNLVEKSISMALLPPALSVLEIGPGLGTLTESLPPPGPSSICGGDRPTPGSTFAG